MIRDATAVPSRAISLAALPTAPSVGRAFVRQVLRGSTVSADCAETTELLASELVTNAVRHTGRVEGSPFPKATETVAMVALRLKAIGAVVRLEVWDADPTLPRMTDADADAESGRGLVLVSALSERWGSYRSRLGGKTVWCEVAIATDSKPPAAVTPVAHKPLPKRVRTTRPARTER
jgi:anti-sigma regulatory factor (Ser/Thr protein kinase)